MSDKELEIFKLCDKLSELLGEPEAIANLKTLHNLHPEMFQSLEQVSKLIKEVVKEPDFIFKNPTPKSEKDFINAKALNDKKMGEVGIRNDNGTNVIFHANEKRLKELERIKKNKEAVDGRDAHTSYTQAQSLDGRLVQKNISTTANKSITQNNTQNTKNKGFSR